ncbi:uncharacterized protein LOC121297895 isoform X2 [Polyodon spathula]|uniref:uncharacterized protein LOC121297895 isoform X2 n=1 Tax=Polyodon spathula TaxID=7913 RepID=UPI001B7E9EA4|nr:uncharacterized protein LOC121297895 isoform X2 [Polyodon spathula]
MKFMVFLVCFCSANIVCQVYSRDISASREKLGLNGGMVNGLPQMPQVVPGVPLLVFQQPGAPNGQQGLTGLPLTPQLNPSQLPQQALGVPQLQGQLLQIPHGMLTQLGFPQQPGAGLPYYVILPQSNAAGLQQPANPVQQQVQLQHSASGMAYPIGENAAPERTIQTLPVIEAQEPIPGTEMPAVTGEETQVPTGSIATGPASTGEAINPFSV